MDELKTLGSRTEAPKTYDPSVLEAFSNRHPGRDYWVTFTAPEFTTLCPKTGQPDFATLTIRYVPAKRLVESKSLKLYLFGFRNFLLRRSKHLMHNRYLLRVDERFSVKAHLHVLLDFRPEALVVVQVGEHCIEALDSCGSCCVEHEASRKKHFDSAGDDLYLHTFAVISA